MQLEWWTGKQHRMRLGTFGRENWLLAVALHPLIRVLVLLEPPGELTGIQVAERFLWFSFWVIEAAVLVIASRDGFRVFPGVRALSPTVLLLTAIWLAAVAIATLNAMHFPRAIRSASIWTVHGLFALAVWHLATRNRARFEQMFNRFAVLLAWATVVAGAAAMVAVFSIGPSSDYPFVGEIPGFAHIRHSGYIFAPAMALSLGRLATVPRESRMSMVLLTLNVALCLWFGSRGPFFGLMAGLVTASALFPEFRSRAFWVRCAAASVGGAFLSVVVPSPENSAFNAIRRFLNGSTDPTEFTSGRIAFWKDAVRLIAERPLFGYGGEQFSFVSPVAGTAYRHPHDFILQVIFDWGAIGGSAFLALLALGMTTAIRMRQTATAAGRVALFSAVSLLGFAVLDGVLFYSYTIGVTLILVMAALALSTAGVAQGSGRARSAALSAA